MIAKGNKRLVGVAFNLEGPIEPSEISALRDVALRDTDSTQTIFFNDASTGGQAAFVFEIYDIEGATLIQRIRHFFRKLHAAALAYIRKGTFVTVIIKGKSSVFPVHGA